MDAQANSAGASSDDGRDRWQRRFDQAAKRDADFTTLSGVEARAEATLGEICGALRAEWGTYAEPAAF